MSSPPRTAHTRRVPFPIFDEPPAATTPSLPANHFLAQRPVTPPPQASVIAERYWATRARPDTSSLAAADYDVSVQTGFLPPEPPIARLGKAVGGGWVRLEEMLEQAQDECRGLEGGGVGRLGDDWRAAVREASPGRIGVSGSC